MSGPVPIIPYDGPALLPGTIVHSIPPWNKQHPNCSRCNKRMVLCQGDFLVEDKKALYWDCSCVPDSVRSNTAAGKK